MSISHSRYAHFYFVIVSSSLSLFRDSLRFSLFLLMFPCTLYFLLLLRIVFFFLLPAVSVTQSFLCVAFVCMCGQYDVFISKIVEMTTMMMVMMISAHHTTILDFLHLHSNTAQTLDDFAFGFAFRFKFYCNLFTRNGTNIIDNIRMHVISICFLFRSRWICFLRLLTTPIYCVLILVERQ